MSDTPVFTTSNPGFMCSVSDCNQSFIDMMREAGERKILHTDKMLGCYIDGKLQSLLGFDIPIFLHGTITGETQDCIVWNVDGDVAYAAEISYNHPPHDHTYIRIKSLPNQII